MFGREPAIERPSLSPTPVQAPSHPLVHETRLIFAKQRGVSSTQVRRDDGAGAPVPLAARTARTARAARTARPGWEQLGEAELQSAGGTVRASHSLSFAKPARFSRNKREFRQQGCGAVRCWANGATSRRRARVCRGRAGPGSASIRNSRAGVRRGARRGCRDGANEQPAPTAERYGYPDCAASQASRSRSIRAPLTMQ